MVNSHLKCGFGDWSSAWDPLGRARRPHDGRVTKRAEYTFALYSGSLAEPGDRNPYAGRSLLLAKLWLRGYLRALDVRIQTGPAMGAIPRL